MKIGGRNLTRWVVLAAAVVGIAATLAMAAGTDLSIRYAGPDTVMIESSTGRGAELPLATDEAAGLMSSAQVRTLEAHSRQRRFVDEAVISGSWRADGALVLITSVGRQVVIPRPTPGPAPVRYVGWAQAADISTCRDGALSQAEIDTAIRYTTQDAAPPAADTYGCLWIAAPLGASIQVFFNGGEDQFNTFTARENVTLDSVEYQAWQTSAPQNEAIIFTGSYNLDVVVDGR